MAASLGKGHALWAFQRGVVDTCSFEATREGWLSLAKVSLLGPLTIQNMDRERERVDQQYMGE